MNSPANGDSHQGPCLSGTVLRRISDTPYADLVGRRVWILADDRDGLGDTTLSLARIFSGSMNAHKHFPGGEFMYVADGHGSVWVEGVELPLEEGKAAFVPPGLWHNAENPFRRDLLVVGITSPGVVPGSYEEIPPLFSPTGRIDTVDRFACHERPTAAPGGVAAVLLEPEEADTFPVQVRRLELAGGSTLVVQSQLYDPNQPGRAWVLLGGTASMACDAGKSHRLHRFDTWLVKPRGSARVTSGELGSTLLEILPTLSKG